MDDCLLEIPEEDLPLLRDLYKYQDLEAQPVYIYLSACLKWMKEKPDANHFSFFGIGRDWLRTGTIVIRMQSYLFFYTLDDDFEKLSTALTHTKRFDWAKTVIWFAISTKHTPMVFDILNDMKLSFYHHLGYTWQIDKAKALDYDVRCPDDVYVEKLDESHVKFIESHWPLRFEGSYRYLAALIEVNGSYGVFLKNDGKLVTWILTNHMGQLATLQTLPEHTRKGYAMLVTKMLAKDIAESGYDPTATIVKGNVASERMFGNMGFRIIDGCAYIASTNK